MRSRVWCGNALTYAVNGITYSVPMNPCAQFDTCVDYFSTLWFVQRCWRLWSTILLNGGSELHKWNWGWLVPWINYGIRSLSWNNLAMSMRRKCAAASKHRRAIRSGKKCGLIPSRVQDATYCTHSCRHVAVVSSWSWWEDYATDSTVSWAWTACIKCSVTSGDLHTSALRTLHPVVQG